MYAKFYGSGRAHADNTSRKRGSCEAQLWKLSQIMVLRQIAISCTLETSPCLVGTVWVKYTLPRSYNKIIWAADGAFLHAIR